MFCVAAITAHFVFTLSTWRHGRDQAGRPGRVSSGWPGTDTSPPCTQISTTVNLFTFWVSICDWQKICKNNYEHFSFAWFRFFVLNYLSFDIDLILFVFMPESFLFFYFETILKKKYFSPVFPSWLWREKLLKYISISIYLKSALVLTPAVCQHQAGASVCPHQWWVWPAQSRSQVGPDNCSYNQDVNHSITQTGQFAQDSYKLGQRDIV